MQQQNHPDSLSLTPIGETLVPSISYAQADASSSIAPTGGDATMPNVPIVTGDCKRRMVSAEEREELHAAESFLELALIFDTSAGKKGAFGGLGGDVRESTERTINDIVQATVPNVHIEQARVDSINVFATPSFYIVILVSRDNYDRILGPKEEVHQTIDFYLYGSDGQKTSKRSDVAIIITTPDHVPNLSRSSPIVRINPPRRAD
jgi:hypothetical protein